MNHHLQWNCVPFVAAAWLSMLLFLLWISIFCLAELPLFPLAAFVCWSSQTYLLVICVLSSQMIYPIRFPPQVIFSVSSHVTSVTSCDDSREDGHQGTVWISSEAGSMLGWNQRMTLHSPSPKVTKLGSLISETFPIACDVICHMRQDRVWFVTGFPA